MAQLGAPTLIRSAHAQSADEATVKKAVEELRMAWLKQDKAKIESLTAEQLKFIADHGSGVLSEEFYSWLVEESAKTLRAHI